jgi:adenylate kinase
MLRQAVNAGSSLGQEVKKIMEEGRLVPDDVMIRLVKNRISDVDCQQGFLLDGFPRTLPQAESLRENNIFFDYVIHLSLPDDEIIKRLSGRRVHVPSGRIYHVEYQTSQVEGIDDVTGEPLIHRPDDFEETIRKRLKIYHEQTEPLIKYYQDAGKLEKQPVPRYIKINGSGTVDEVKDRIFAALAKQ